MPVSIFESDRADQTYRKIFLIVTSKKMSLQQLTMSFEANVWGQDDDDIIRELAVILSKNPKSMEELDLEAVSKLLRHVTSFNGWGPVKIKDFLKYKTNLTPLQTALISGKIGCVMSMLEKGEKPLGSVWYVDSLVKCCLATENEDVRKILLSLLFKHGLDPKFCNQENQNILSIFISYFVSEDDDFAVETAEVLTQHGISVAEFDCKGWTPLTYAIFKENIPLVSFLIKKGAIINYSSEMMKISNQYPLVIAADANNKDLLDLILLNGADVNFKTLNGWTALHEACYSCHEQSIECLIQGGADVNVEDNHGWTPFAVQNTQSSNYDESVRIMVKEFANRINKNFLVSEKNVDLMKKIPKALKYFELCEYEIKQMEKTIFYFPYSYYFVFQAPKNRLQKLSHLTKNEEFVTKFGSSLNKFSIYKNDLQRIFKKASEIRDESLIVQKKLYSVFGNYFSDVIMRKLVKNITLKDVALL